MKKKRKYTKRKKHNTTSKENLGYVICFVDKDSKIGIFGLKETITYEFENGKLIFLKPVN